jgi:hypothetical protein
MKKWIGCSSDLVCSWMLVYSMRYVYFISAKRMRVVLISRTGGLSVISRSNSGDEAFVSLFNFWLVHAFMY